MRYESIRAIAFGLLSHKTLELGPGFNVIYGKNESGKSTWRAAMYAALCGVRRGGGVRKSDQEFRERYAPWEQADWMVGARVRLADERTFDLRHELNARIDCSATDSATGRDVSNTVISDGTPDGSLWLGLNRSVFAAVACVDQADILGIRDDADALQEKLQLAVASPEAKATAAKALERLKDFKSSAVGLDQANSRRPLMQAKRQLARANEELAEARRLHTQYESFAVEVRRLTLEAEGAARTRRLVEGSLALAQASEEQDRLDRATALAARYPEAPRGSADEEQLSIRVATALAEWGQRSAPVSLSGPSAMELSEMLDALPNAPTGDTLAHESVLQAQKAWDRACALLEDHNGQQPPAVSSSPSATSVDPWTILKLADTLSEGETVLAPEIQTKLSAAMEEVGAARSRRTRSFALGAVGVVGAAVAVALFAAGTPLAAGLLVALALAAGAVAVVSGRGMPLWQAQQEESAVRAAASAHKARLDESRQGKERAAARARELGLPEDPSELARLGDTMLQAGSSRAFVQAWQSRDSALSGEAQRAAVDLELALRSRPFSLRGTLQESLDEYQRECALNAEQLNQFNTKPDIESRLGERLAAEERANAEKGRHDAAEAALISATAAVGRPCDDAELAQLYLEEWQDGRGGRAQSQQAATAEWQELLALLNEASEAEREAKVSDLLARAQRLLGGASPVDIGDQREGQASLEVARASEEDWRDRRARAEGQLHELASKLPSVAEMEEGLAIAEAELARVRSLEAVLDQTVGFLQRAGERVQRDIAPVLAAFVEPRIRTITNGRYETVRVDPATLDVTVEDRQGARRRASMLSFGTAEQTYLLLRVALARLLCVPGESCPLILDDVTVQSDSERTVAMLEVLRELSSEQQIILFTQEEDVAAWAVERLRDARHAFIQLAADGTPTQLREFSK